MISLVVAMSENNCIGSHGTLPWHIPEDMARVKSLTQGKVIVMGRNTWESIPTKFRPLSNRINVVITSQREYPVPEAVHVFSSVDDALAAFREQDIVAFGGRAIYEAMLPKVEILHVTRVHSQVEGDTFFPEIDWSEWKETERSDQGSYSFLTYTRIH